MAIFDNFEEFYQNIQEITEERARKWWEVVSSMMGFKCETTLQWSSIFIKQVTGLYDDMLNETVQRRNEMLTKIEALLKKASSLCKDLNITLPNYGSQCLTLFEEQEYLIKWISKHEEKVEMIMGEVKKLNKEELSLAKSLGKTPKPLQLQPLPGEEMISKFKTYLEELESLKFEREEQFLAVKSEILNLVDELKYEPVLDFELMVLSLDDSLFNVSDTNMNQVNAFLESLKQLSSQMKEEIFDLREKLKSLWDLLNEDLMVRDEFLNNNTGNNAKTLKALQEEVTRCENLKKTNIELFVSRLRVDLVALWDKCHISVAERDQFEYFKSDVYSEDLLSIHDLEITKLNVYFNSNSNLFNLLEKRSECWSRMLELEDSTSAPGRLKNRGCQLLKEEKERNALLKRLPKIEEQLLQLAEAYEMKHKKPFYSYGRTVYNIISDSHNAHDEDKKLKLSARKQKREKTPCKLTSGMTSSISVQNLALTPQTGVKRKLANQLEVPSSRTKILHEHNNVTKTAPPKLMHAQRTGRSRLSIERSKRIDKCRQISRRKLEKDLTMRKENISSEYVMFEKDLGSKEGCRSTLYEKENTLALPLPPTPHSNAGKSTNTGLNDNNPLKLSTAPRLCLHF